jgi:hypothetical protein
LRATERAGRGLHRATLVFDAPTVDSPTLFWFSGMFSRGVGRVGYGIRRSVLVRPHDWGERSPVPERRTLRR